MTKKRIWLSLATMTGREQDYIREAFDTNWVVPLGPNVDGLEHDLKEFLGEDKPVVALSSGTAALHLALLQLGIKAGDEVICQSFTFAASANPITYLGGQPVFVDSEPDTWNMDPDCLETAIQDRYRQTGAYPKAVIPVCLYGMPPRMDEILKICSRYNIPVVEDAAEALGSEYNGRKCGTLGTWGVLSFNGNKMITTSGGGALVCSTPEEARQTKFLATQARDAAPHYQHSQIGYNYRMSNICAGIGRGQMTGLDRFVARRQKIHDIYRSKLEHLNGITLMNNPSPAFSSNFWLPCILIHPETGITREDVRLAMEAENIETRPLWKPMHLQPVFANAHYYGGKVAETIFDQGLCLPSGSALTEDDLERVMYVLEKLFVPQNQMDNGLLLSPEARSQ